MVPKMVEVCSNFSKICGRSYSIIRFVQLFDTFADADRGDRWNGR